MSEPTLRSEPNVHLDLRGLKCPLPVLHARRALQRCTQGEVVEVACTDPMAVIDIPVMALQDGHAVEEQHEEDGVYLFRLRAGGKANAG